MSRAKPTDTFHINFDTLEMPGKIVCTEVTLRKNIAGDRNRVYRIDLCDHPLYPSLCEYVAANPPKKRD